MSENNIDRIFKEKLYDHAALPPSDSWSNIEDALHNHKKSRFISIYWAMAASLALLVGIGTGFYIGINHQKDIGNSIASNNKTNTIKKIKTNEIKTVSNNQTIENPVISEKNANNKSITFTNSKNTADNILEEKTNIETTTVITKNTEVEKDVYEQGQTTLLAYQESKSITNLKNTLNYELCLNTLYAMEEKERPETENVSKTQYFIGVNWTPLYAYRNIGYNNTSISTTTYDKSEKPIYSFSGGLSFGIIHNRWYFQTGISYTQMGQQIPNASVPSTKRNTYLAGDDASWTSSVSIPKYEATANSMGNFEAKELENSEAYANVKSEATYRSESQVSTVKYLINYSFIEVPILASYKVSTRLIDFRFTGGASLNFVINNRVKLFNGSIKENIGTNSNAAPFNLAGIIEWGIDLPMTSKLHFVVGPQLRYFLNSINKSTNIKTYPYSIGINATLQYHL
ncbi:MAG TPA: hypothetical protein PK252_09705 [Bacteroidales bacterium]|nr:hypothetical protein [Bacteroidales bacterium]